MRSSDFEKRLQEHARITKSVIEAPFNIEREKVNMTNTKNKNVKRTVLIAAAIACLIGTTVFAAFRLLGAKEVARTLGDTKLAQYFDEKGTVSDTITDGDYKATVLGIASGKELSKFKSSSWDVFPERTYAVVAVEKSDGSAMTFDDEILITPLIEGLAPWKYNIFTMNGGYIADIIDGVLYRIVEFDNIEYFADRDVYMAVLSESFLSNKPYSFDEKTGRIAPRKDYDGTNILIKLNLDKSKANPEKAAEYLEKLKEISNQSDENTEAEIEDTEEIAITQDMLEAVENE